jgi:hypothetical protein
MAGAGSGLQTPLTAIRRNFTAQMFSMLSSLGTGWRLHREIAFEAFHGSGEGGSKLSEMDEVLTTEPEGPSESFRFPAPLFY